MTLLGFILELLALLVVPLRGVLLGLRILEAERRICFALEGVPFVGVVDFVGDETRDLLLLRPVRGVEDFRVEDLLLLALRVDIK